MELKNYQKQTLAKLAAYLTEAKVIGSEAAFQNQQDAPGYPTKYAPIPNLEGVPYVCLRLPTGGGKTLLGSRRRITWSRNIRLCFGWCRRIRYGSRR